MHRAVSLDRERGGGLRILEDLDPEENLIHFSDADDATETQDLQSMGELMLEERVEKPNEKRELGGINEEKRFILLSSERDEFEAMPGTDIEREMTFEHDDHSDGGDNCTREDITTVNNRATRFAKSDGVDAASRRRHASFPFGD